MKYRMLSGDKLNPSFTQFKQGPAYHFRVNQFTWYLSSNQCPRQLFR